MVKAIGWLVSILLFLMIAAFAFVYFSPDYNMYLVSGRSMEPALNLGDMVLTGPPGGLLGGEVTPGAVVTYQRGNSFITHRVITADGDNLITKGDASEDVDPLPIPISQISGVCLLRIPYLGHLSNFMRTTVGWLTVVIAPSIITVGFLVKKIAREAMSTAQTATLAKRGFPGAINKGGGQGIS